MLFHLKYIGTSLMLEKKLCEKFGVLLLDKYLLLIILISLLKSQIVEGSQLKSQKPIVESTIHSKEPEAESHSRINFHQ